MTTNPTIKCLLAKLAIFFLLLTFCRAQCSWGCLKCSSADPEKSSCLLCDFKAGYMLTEEASCEKKSASNCEILNYKADSSECFRCRPSYRLDAQTLKCEEVLAEKVLPGCKYYDSNGNCQQCEEGFVVDAGKCKDLGEKAVENCASYVNEQCMSCLGDLRFDGEKCVTFEKNIEGCGVYTDLECTECADDYQKDFLRSIMTMSNSLTEDFLKKLTMMDYSSQKFKKDIANVCFRKEHVNCLESLDSKTCSKCLPGHHPVSSQKCDPNPTDAILQCKVYQNLETCMTCHFGFYLKKNECLKVKDVPFCSEYHMDEDKCISCKSDDNMYFIKDGACEPRVNSKEKCKEYSPSEDECMSCDSVKMYKKNNQCVERKQVASCEEYAPEKDECLKCAGTQRLTDDNLKCLPEVAFCKTYQNSTDQSTKFMCDACDEPYYTMDNETCMEKKVDDCKQLKKGNVNECQTCHDSFYLDEKDGSCKSQSVNDCETYKANTNECTKCKDLFYLNAKACSAVDPTLNCLHSDGQNNTCTECAGDRYMMQGLCQPRNNPHDARCKANSGIQDDTSCTKCTENDSIATVTHMVLSTEQMNALFCAEIDIESGNCLQCAENAEALTGQVCKEAANKNSSCLQLKKGVFEELGNNVGSCAKCRDSEKFFLSFEGTCISRDNYTTKNCKKLSPSSDACLGFEPEMTVHKVAKIGHCAANPPEKNVTIPNCIYFDSNDLTKCLVCQIGKELNQDSTECVKSTYSSVPYMDKMGDFKYPVITPESPGFVANCTSFSYDKFAKKLLCHTCGTGFHHVLDFESDAVIARYYTYTGQNFPSEFPVKECVSTLKPYKDAKKSDFNTSEFCNFYRYNPQDDSHECVECRTGTQTVYAAASFKSDGVTEVTNKNVISECKEEMIDFTVMKESLGLQLVGEPELRYLYLLRHNMCSDKSMKLILFFEIMTLPGRNIEIPDIFSGEDQIAYQCRPDVTSSVSEHCAINWAPGMHLAKQEAAVVAPKCLACKSGYKPVFDPETKVITDCLAIENCNSPNGFNTCSFCNKGFFNPYDDTKKSSDRTQCVSAGKSTLSVNCQFFGNGKCYLCQTGFVYNDKGECVENPEKSSNNCSSEYLFSSKISEIQTRQEYDQFQFNVINTMRPYILGCVACNFNFKPVTTLDTSAISETSIYPGTEWITEMKLEPIENCKLRLEYSSEKCAECESGFLLKEDDKTCVLATSVAQSHPNCKSLETVDNELKCASCEDTHSLNEATKMCDLEHNCDLYHTRTEGVIKPTRVCSLCKENFKSKEENSLICEPNENEKDVCAQFALENHCFKCKESGKVPINYLNITEMKYEYKCIDFAVENMPKFVEQKYMFFAMYNPLSLDAFMFHSTIVPHDGIMNREVKHSLASGKSFDGQLNKSICVPVPKDENCKTRVVGKCFECNEQFFLDSDTWMCQTGEIPGCQVYADKTTCDTCEKSHLKDKENKCVKRVAKNCENESKDADECTSCVDGHFLKTVSGDCGAKAEYCDQCLPYTKAAGCSEMEETQDACKKCEDTHYLEDADKSCVPRQKQNCKMYEKSKDKCQSCNSEHYFESESGSCVDPKAVEGCESYNASVNKCSKCKENMFLDEKENKCLKNPDGIPGCQDYSARTSCEACKDGMYLKDNKCMMSETKVDHCAKYNADGECKMCLDSHLLVQNKCEQKNKSACAKWKDVDNCEACPKDKVLKKVGEQDDCVALGITNCEEGKLDGESILCTKCKEKMLPAADGLSCVVPATAIVGCQNYDQMSSKDAPKCERCEINRILSVSRESCKSASQISDGSCDRGKELAENKCMYCQPGNRFDKEENKCVPCGGEGCLECDYTDSEKCFLCRTGYSMKVFGECEAPTPEVPKFAMRLNMVSLVVFALMALLKFD